ncbi:MAG: PQQ-binding-like beta-propeller repeat protein, partial [Phycisphaerales bacterium]
MKSPNVDMGNVSALFLTISLCVALMGFHNTAGAADWPNYRGPDHNGITKETDWKTNWADSGPKVLWKKSIGIGFSSMAVVGGKVYAMGNQGKKEDVVYCFDAVTGEEIWTHSYPCPLEPKYY